MKIRQVEAELFDAEKWTVGRTEWHDEADSSFSNFANALKNMLIYIYGNVDRNGSMKLIHSLPLCDVTWNGIRLCVSFNPLALELDI